MLVETVESVQSRADNESRQAWNFITEQPRANAQAIAEGIDEPAVLIEQIIKVLHSPGSIHSAYEAVSLLVAAEVRKYANDQAEAAHNHVMSTPS